MAFLGIDWGIHNLLTCKGFASNAGANLGIASFDIGGPCSMAKLGAVMLFFLIAIIRKWGGEEMGMDFSFLWGEVFGLGAYLAVITFTGSMKLAFIAGLLGGLIGGYAGGYIIGSFGGGEGDDGSSAGYSE